MTSSRKVVSSRKLDALMGARDGTENRQKRYRVSTRVVLSGGGGGQPLRRQKNGVLGVPAEGPWVFLRIRPPEDGRPSVGFAGGLTPPRLASMIVFIDFL